MSDRTQLVLILALALAVRLAAGVWWQARLQEPFGFGDSASYWTLAERIAEGESYSFGPYRCFRTPGYPTILAPLVALLGNDLPGVRAARVASALLTVAAIAITYLLAGELYGVRVARWAALALAILPDAIGLGVFVLSEAPFCPLMMGELWLAVRAWRADSDRAALRLSAGSGVLAGLASLMRPSWLLFVPFALAVGMLCRANRWRHVRLGAAALVGLVAAMSPWWARNALVYGHFIPTSLQTGASLYDGLNEHADGSSNMRYGDEAAQRFVQQNLQLAPEELEYQLDRHLRDEAIRWAIDRPDRVFLLSATKFLRIWNLWPNEPSFRSLSLRAAVALTYGPLMALAATALFRLRPCGWPAVLLTLPAVYITALHVIFVSSIRYRQPALLPLAILAAVGVAWCLRVPLNPKTPAAAS